MKLWHILAGLGVAGTIGVAVFFSSRKAVAADKAGSAFLVSIDCNTIEVIDMKGAEEAVIAAALAVRPSMGTPAIAAIIAICTVVFPACDWLDIPPNRVFKTADGEMGWAAIEIAVGDMTLGELADKAAEGGFGVPGMQSAIAVPYIARWVGQAFGPQGSP